MNNDIENFKPHVHLEQITNSEYRLYAWVQLPSGYNLAAPMGGGIQSDPVQPTRIISIEAFPDLNTIFQCPVVIGPITLFRDNTDETNLKIVIYEGNDDNELGKAILHYIDADSTPYTSNEPHIFLQKEHDPMDPELQLFSLVGVENGKDIVLTGDAVEEGRRTLEYSIVDEPEAVYPCQYKLLDIYKQKESQRGADEMDFEVIIVENSSGNTRGKAVIRHDDADEKDNF